MFTGFLKRLSEYVQVMAPVSSAPVAATSFSMSFRGKLKSARSRLKRSKRSCSEGRVDVVGLHLNNQHLNQIRALICRRLVFTRSKARSTAWLCPVESPDPQRLRA